MTTESGTNGCHFLVRTRNSCDFGIIFRIDYEDDDEDEEN